MNRGLWPIATRFHESLVVPTKIKRPSDLQLSARAGAGMPARQSIMSARRARCPAPLRCRRSSNQGAIGRRRRTTEPIGRIVAFAAPSRLANANEPSP